MITYGANKNERTFGTYSKGYNNADRLAELTRERNAKIRYIEDVKKILDRSEKELREIEKEFYVLSNLELNKQNGVADQPLSKKQLIIQYYNLHVPFEKIVEAVGGTQSYVSKVLSEYRKENGIEKTSKGQITKQRIIQCLSSGMSINKTAAAVNVTPQYVCTVKKEYENNL